MTLKKIGFVTYLWCQVEPQITVVAERVFYEKWHFIAQAEPDLITETAGLAEVDKVFERESERNRFAEIDLHILCLVIDIGMRAKRNRARTDVSGAVKLHTFFCAFYGNCSQC